MKFWVLLTCIGTIPTDDIEYTEFHRCYVLNITKSNVKEMKGMKKGNLVVQS